MAIVFLQKEKKQRNLIIVFAAVILISLLVLWLGVFSEEEPEVEEIPLFPKREIKIDFGVLENPKLENFRPFSEIESFKESTTTGQIIGRENPFLLY